jgi:hypothetical protein
MSMMSIYYVPQPFDDQAFFLRLQFLQIETFWVLGQIYFKFIEKELLQV